MLDELMRRPRVELTSIHQCCGSPLKPDMPTRRICDPEVAKHLAVDDVLVDSMRGRSSTWTRIRVNLRNVPEAIRPPQGRPDPDDDPTRALREKWRASKAG